MASPLADILNRAAAGSPPDPDGGVTVLAQPSERDAGVISFTAHSVVFADVAAGWVRARLPDGDGLAAPLSPKFLMALADRLGRQAGHLDLLTVAAGLSGPPPMELTEIAGTGHPRVRRARRFRDELSVWTGDGVIVIIGRGVAGGGRSRSRSSPAGGGVASAGRPCCPPGTWCLRTSRCGRR